MMNEYVPVSVNDTPTEEPTFENWKRMRNILLFLCFAVSVFPFYLTIANPCSSFSASWWPGVVASVSTIYIVTLLHSTIFHAVANFKHDERHFYFQFLEELSMYLCMGMLVMLINYWAYSLFLGYFFMAFIFSCIVLGLYSASFWSRIFYVSAITDPNSTFIKAFSKNYSAYAFLLFLDFVWIGAMLTFLCVAAYYYTEVTNGSSRPCNCPGSTVTCA